MRTYTYNNRHKTLRKHAYSNILKILPPENENFEIKKSDIFHISAQNIDCGYSLEPSRRGGSNEYPQSMFLSRTKINNVYPCKPQFYYIGMFSWWLSWTVTDEPPGNGTCSVTLSMLGSRKASFSLQVIYYWAFQGGSYIVTLFDKCFVVNVFSFNNYGSLWKFIQLKVWVIELPPFLWKGWQLCLPYVLSVPV